MLVLLKFVRSIAPVKRLLRRPLRQQWLAIEAALTLWSVKAMLVGLPFERWRHIMQRPPPLPSKEPPSTERVAEIVWAVDRISQRWPSSLTCLPRAIAVRCMLARRRWNCRLEIGVGRDAVGRFEAHAWVEYGDQVIIGNVPSLGRYTKLPIQRVPQSRAIGIEKDP